MLQRLLWAALFLAITAGAGIGAQSAKSERTRAGIAYDVQGQGPVVVLISGSNLDRRMWNREAAWLAPSHTVVRYDLRAHGASDTATAPFTHLDDLLELLNEIRAQKVTLIGLSAGSTIALDAALAEPSRVQKLILVGPAISGFRSSIQLPFAAALVAALKAADYVRASEVLLASSVFAAPPPSEALVRQMVMDNNRLWSVPRGFLRQVERPAIDRLHELKMPVLIMLGSADEFQREEAGVLAERVTGARLVVVPGGGHLLNLTSPEAFRAEVSRFLR
jgi:pimeloyl-ACP methyl ester carboxylesterase